MKYLPALLIALFTSSVLFAADPEKVELRLTSDPAKALSAQRDKLVEVSSSKASKFRIVPGLAGAASVSLELIGAKGYYVRHQNFVGYVQERPKNRPQFHLDATFHLIRSAGDQARFEA